VTHYQNVAHMKFICYVNINMCTITGSTHFKVIFTFMFYRYCAFWSFHTILGHQESKLCPGISCRPQCRKAFVRQTVFFIHDFHVLSSRQTEACRHAILALVQNIMNIWVRQAQFWSCKGSLEMFHVLNIFLGSHKARKVMLLLDTFCPISSQIWTFVLFGQGKPD
jgi:hypothetical protein